MLHMPNVSFVWSVVIVMLARASAFRVAHMSAGASNETIVNNGVAKEVGSSSIWPFDDIYYALNKDAELKARGGMTSLGIACWHSKPPKTVLRKLNKYGVDQVNKVDKMWMTPFAWAALRWTRHVDSVNEAYDPKLAANDRANVLLLLKHGAKPLIGFLPKRPLFQSDHPVWTGGQAVFEGQYDEHALPTQEDAQRMAMGYRSGGHLMIMAAALGDFELIENVLNAVDDKNDIVRVLNTRGKHRRTPLHVVMTSRPTHSKEVAKVLLSAAPAEKLVLHFKDLDGRSCLHLAVLQRSIDWATLLLGYLNAPDLEAVRDDDDRGGSTALHYAVAGDAADLKMATLLLDHGFPVDAKSLSGQSVLDCAVNARNAAAVRLLLVHGASLADYKIGYSNGSVLKREVKIFHGRYSEETKVSWVSVPLSIGEIIFAEITRRTKADARKLDARVAQRSTTTAPGSWWSGLW